MVEVYAGSMGGPNLHGGGLPRTGNRPTCGAGMYIRIMDRKGMEYMGAGGRQEGVDEEGEGRR